MVTGLTGDIPLPGSRVPQPRRHVADLGNPIPPVTSLVSLGPGLVMLVAHHVPLVAGMVSDVTGDALLVTQHVTVVAGPVTLVTPVIAGAPDQVPPVTGLVAIICRRSVTAPATVAWVLALGQSQSLAVVGRGARPVPGREAEPTRPQGRSRPSAWRCPAE